MVLIDREIKQLAGTVIQGFDEESVINIGYDLTAKAFHENGTNKSQVFLEPGESVFVSSKEIIELRKDLLARVVLKNSRIRQGFAMDAPVYQPGHKTRVFVRLTNVSSDRLALKAGEQYVTLIFEQLSAEPDKPYDKGFNDEFDFKGLAHYHDAYAEQIEAIEKKTEDLKSMEKTIYGNVLVIISVFVALFSFITTNLSLLTAHASTESFLIHNFVLLGAVSFLVALLQGLIKEASGVGRWSPSVIFFGLALLLWVI